MSIYVLVALAAISVETNVETTPIFAPPAPPPSPAVRAIDIPTPPVSQSNIKEGSPPIPKGNPGYWANADDYPLLALEEEREGIAGFRLTVGKDGRVMECEITQSSGHSDLDEATCANITKRAEFHPARDKNGHVITGTYANRIRWQIPEMESFASHPIPLESYPYPPQPLNLSDLVIPTEDYPASALAAGEQGTSVFALDIDDAGKVKACNITSSSGSLALDQQACLVSARWTFRAARDIDGKPTFGRTKHSLEWVLPTEELQDAPSPIPNMFHPFEKAGSFTLTLDFDVDGKMVNCAVEQKGDYLFMGASSAFMGQACDDGFKQNLKPFVNAEGKPEARRVIFRMGVEHTDAVLPEKAK